MAIASPGAIDPNANLWMLGRARLRAAICIGAFYYNDLSKL